MKLSRTVVYALQAVCQLGAADSTTPVPSKKLAEGGGMPDRFLLQILRNLVSHGLLRSTRGVVGGYRLARSPAEISLLEVIEAVEGPVSFKLTNPTPQQANLEHALNQLTASVRQELSRLKLAELLPPKDAGEHTDPIQQ